MKELAEQRPQRDLSYDPVVLLGALSSRCSPLSREHKEADEKRGELAFNCPSLTSWKELLCCGARRNKPKETTKTLGVYWWFRRRKLFGRRRLFFVSISRIDWRRRCAGTCLQGKRKFRSEGMRRREQHRKGIPLLILLFSFTSDILEVFMPGMFVHGPVLNPMCAKWSRRGADQSQRIKSTHGAFGGALSAETTFCAFAVCTEVTWKS